MGYTHLAITPLQYYLLNTTFFLMFIGFRAPPFSDIFVISH